MKTIRKVGMAALVAIVCSLTAACSSDDDEDESGIVATGRLAKVEIVGNWGAVAMFAYASDGEISDIHISEDGFSEDISYVISQNVISWTSRTSDGKRYTYRANIENGRAQSMTRKNCLFRYDGSNRLVELECREWNGVFKLTWSGGNITRLEQYNNGKLEARIDYTYSNHQAGMLGYMLYFNPLTENNFLDTFEEHALFYTDACGQMSKNLPATATFYGRDGKSKGTRTYEYKTNGGRISQVVISGNHNDSLYDYPVSLKITWE